MQYIYITINQASQSLSNHRYSFPLKQNIMKTTTLHTLNVLITLFLFLPSVYTQTASVNPMQKVSAEDRVGTIIDVKGNRFSDRMWVITVPQCTRDFDNGWDGYKMFGSSIAPQICAMEENGNFQVNSIPDINNTYLGFRTGEDTTYTLTFTHYFLENRYKELYLVDLQNNKKINIYANGSQYTFTAQKSPELVKRFELVSVDYPPVIVPENNVGTIIDVQGSRFNDKLSIYSVPECTRNYDSNWDVYKTFSSSLKPQLYAMEVDGTYQVDGVNDLNDTYLGFLPGEDLTYTLKFTNYNLNTRYQKLYLIDLLENKTIDIYTTGKEYTFVAEQSNNPVKRFKIVTILPTPNKNINNEQINPVDPNKSIDPVKNLKIFNSQKTIVIDNPYAEGGNLTLYNAQSGMLVSTLNFAANTISTIPTNVPDGVYVVKGITKNETLTKRIIVR